jgi:hypothetical protein
MRLPLIALVATLFLAGCAAQRLAEREAYLGQFIGQSEADLVRQAGVPTRAVDAGGRRFVVYEERRVDFVPGPPGFGSFGPFGPRYGYGYGAFPPQAIEFLCETTFEINAGRVAGFSLRGNAC